MSNDNNVTIPPYTVKHVRKDNNGQDRWTNVGPGWDGKKENIIADTVFGRLVIEPNKELEKMRQEKAQSQSMAPKQDLEPKM